MTSLPRTAADVGRWAYGLVAAAVLLFSVGLGDRIHCRMTRCTGVAEDRLFDLDAVDSLPRLFTTGLFVALAVVTGVGARRETGRARLWWAATAGIGLALAAAKLTHAHPVVKADNALAALGGGLALAACALAVLWTAARRWGVPAGAPLVLALAGYALAALGLDVLTGLAPLVPGRAGLVLDALATFVEELGEALAAVWVLLTAIRWRPPFRRDQVP